MGSFPALGEIEGVDLTLTFLRDKRARRTGFNSESRSTSAYQPSASGTDHDINISWTFADVNLETRRPGRPVPPMAGAVVHLLATIQVEKFAPAQAANLVVPGYRLGV